MVNIKTTSRYFYAIPRFQRRFILNSPCHPYYHPYKFLYLYGKNYKALCESKEEVN